jgi:chemotaxis protein methyltransferase CheR
MRGSSPRPLEATSAFQRYERLRRDEIYFEKLAMKLRELAGVHLVTSPKNICLMATRLSKVMERHHIDGYRAFLERLQRDSVLVDDFVSAMTTHTTEFFREARHFKLLSEALPAYLRKKPGELRIWCAASSSGQEVYSLLITLLESHPFLDEGSLRVLATDIDRKVLERASLGRYSETDVQAIPRVYLQKYFKKQKAGQGLSFVVNDRLRRLVTFAPFNLMSDAYRFQHGFDVVLCRNVLIYFERDVALAVTDKISQVIRPGGFLMVGHSEAGLVRSLSFETVSSAFYRRTER